MLKANEISVDNIKSGFGGYKKKETKEYLENIRSDYDALCKENLELKDKLSILSEGVQYYKNMEKSLQKALVLAERTTSETVHAAEVKALAMENEAKARAEALRKEAEIEASALEKEASLKANNMIRDAKKQVDSAIAEGNEELRKVHSQIVSLVQQYEQYKAQYKQLVLAQMNVLESEAYNLEAPILKTFQNITEASKETNEYKKEDKEDAVVHPVEQSTMKVTEESEPEKKVYVDGRGHVVEVHEFREINPSDDKKTNTYDSFQTDNTNTAEEKLTEDSEEKADNWSKNDFPHGAMSFNQFDDTASMVQEENVKQAFTMDNADSETYTEVEQPQKADALNQETFEKRDPDAYFKAFDTSQNVKEQDNTFAQNDQITIENVEESDKNFVQNNQADMQAEMKRIERLQLERLQKEEELHTEKMRSRGHATEYQKSVDEMPSQSFSMPNKIVKETPIEEESATRKSDFYSDLEHPSEKPELTLSDLKRMDAEEKRHVPLPSASDENNYFSKKDNTKSTMEEKQIDFDADVTLFDTNGNTSDSSSFAERQIPVQEKEESSVQNTSTIQDDSLDYFKQFTSVQSSNLSSQDNNAKVNSIAYELDHNNTNISNAACSSKFKSFKDFESEL